MTPGHSLDESAAQTRRPDILPRAVRQLAHHGGHGLTIGGPAALGLRFEQIGDALGLERLHRGILNRPCRLLPDHLSQVMEIWTEANPSRTGREPTVHLCNCIDVPRSAESRNVMLCDSNMAFGCADCGHVWTVSKNT